MCLGIPMQIQEINGFVARCEAKGVQREVSLFMLQGEPLAVNDFIVVHLGNAIQKVTSQEAAMAWELYDLEKDPFEMKNLYPNPKYSKIIEAMKVELKNTRADLNETDDKYPYIQAIIDAHWQKE